MLAETVNKLKFTFKHNLVLRDNSVNNNFRTKIELIEAQIKILRAEPLGGVQFSAKMRPK